MDIQAECPALSALKHRWQWKAAAALLVTLFLMATFLSQNEHYRTAFVTIARIGAILALLDRRAAMILLIGIPAMDGYASGYQLALPAAAIVGEGYRLLRQRSSLPATATGLDAGVALFASAILISIPFAVDPNTSTMAAVRVLALVLTYAFASRVMLDSVTMQTAVRSFAGVGAYSALIAWGQSVVPGFPVPALEAYPTGATFPALRASAFYENPNTLAVLLLPAALISLEQAMSALRVHRHRAAAGWLTYVVLTATAIGLTLSRAAFIGLVVGALLLVVMRAKITVRLAVSVVLVLMATSVMLWNTGIGDRALSIVSFSEDPSSMDRVYLSQVSIRMFIDHPLTGVGLSGIPTAYVDYRDPRIAVDVTDGHQMVFSIPAETGVLGLLAQVLIIVSLLKAATQARRHRNRSVPPVAGIAASLAFAAMSFFNYFLMFHAFWFALALAGAYAANLQQQGAREGCGRPVASRHRAATVTRPVARS